MTRFRHSTSSADDSQIDEALRDLFEPAAKPRLRTGFDRRLARAIAADSEARRRSRTLRRVLWGYSLVAAAASVAILWRFQDRLSGPGLWVGFGGLAILAVAGISLSILAALPVKFRRRNPVAR